MKPANSCHDEDFDCNVGSGYLDGSGCGDGSSFGYGNGFGCNEGTGYGYGMGDGCGYYDGFGFGKGYKEDCGNGMSAGYG